MKIQLLRHATLMLSIGGIALLVDPMLSPREALSGTGATGVSLRLPLVDLPIDDDALAALVFKVDAVLVTHLHRDHWDIRAAELIPKETPLFCQPGDEERLRAAGFSTVTPIADTLEWRGLTITRTGGRHGLGETGIRMGPVCGVVLRAAGDPSLYLAGDTVWCAEVEDALRRFTPDVVILNAGAAQFTPGDLLTMGAEDVARVVRAAPQAEVIAVHMETVSHCLETRSALADALQRHGLSVRIPDDGQTLEITQ